jgi:hypothetical protein
MADEGLFGVPMSFTPQDTLLGSLSAGIGRGTPSLISPYASTGTAVGIGLGSILLQSLLGYQARQQAAEQTLELNRLSSSLLGMKTAQERADYIGTLGDVDPLVLGRLGSLSGALAGQEIQQQRALDLERSRKMLGYELELSPEAQQVADLELGRKIAEIEARNAGFTSRLSGVAALPSSEHDQFVRKYFGTRLPVATASDLLYLKPSEKQQVENGELPTNEAIRIATERADEAERTGLREDRAIANKNKLIFQQLKTATDMPATIRKEVADKVELTNIADAIVNEITDDMTWAGLQVKRRWAGFGEGNFTTLIKKLNANYLYALSGKQVNNSEKTDLRSVASGDFTVGPKRLKEILQNFIRDTRDAVKTQIGAATQQPEYLVDVLNKNNTGGQITFQPPTTKYTVDEQGRYVPETVETPTAQTKQQMDADAAKWLKIYNNPPSEKHKELAEQLLRKKGLL